MEIKIKKFHPNAVIPHYANQGDAGMDVYSVSKNETGKHIEYGTGLGFELPQGYVLLVFARSSVTDKDLILGNSVGILDSGFRGELKLRFKKTGEGKDDYSVGERIGQILVLPFPKIDFHEVEELDVAGDRGGGFGSTGN